MSILQSNVFIIGAVIVAILIILNIAIHINVGNSISVLLDGFYSADPVFCEESNLDLMMLYLDNGSGYIMIKGADGSILLNDFIEYKLTRKNKTTSLKHPAVYDIQFKGIEYQDFFPLKQTMEFVPATQRIKLYDVGKSEIHAILYKNNQASDLKSLPLEDQDHSSI